MQKKQASLCVVMGHDWQQTTSDAYRICQRLECMRVQRIYQGYWVNVQASNMPTPMPGSVPIQQNMFDNLSERK